MRKKSKNGKIEEKSKKTKIDKIHEEIRTKLKTKQNKKQKQKTKKHKNQQQ